jgi:hypothetical protein
MLVALGRGIVTLVADAFATRVRALAVGQVQATDLILATHRQIGIMIIGRARTHCP